jgi:hypothetical protein
VAWGIQSGGVSSSIGFNRLFLHYILPLQNNFFFIMPQLITRFLSLYLQSRATPGISASILYLLWELGYLSHYSVRLQTGRPAFDPLQRQTIFHLDSVFRPALRFTQPPMQWVPGINRGRSVTLTTYPHLVRQSRMSRICTSSPPVV